MLMKTLKERFKSILKSECLTQEEKKYLKDMFREFTIRREMLNRPRLEFISEDQKSDQWSRNNLS